MYVITKYKQQIGKRLLAYADRMFFILIVTIGNVGHCGATLPRTQVTWVEGKVAWYPLFAHARNPP